MPLQNRVTPTTELIRTSSRGHLMGNRGVLHDEKRHIVKRWAHRNWILCKLAFKGRHRPIMSPNRYTELFFLDEATGLAAGHRPCAECQRAGYGEFKRHFLAANRPRMAQQGKKIPSQQIDALLHRDRLIGRGRYAKQNRYQAELATLPNGVFVLDGDVARLIWAGKLYRWSPEGYTDPHPLECGLTTVLTPRATVDTIRAGYRVSVHFSAE